MIMIMKTDKYTFQPEFQNVIQDAVQSLCTALRVFCTASMFTAVWLKAALSRPL